MFEQYTNEIPYFVLPSVYSDEFYDDPRSMSWNALVEAFRKVDRRLIKDGPGILPAIAKPRSEWQGTDNGPNAKKTYRNSFNFSHITLLILDLDEPGAIDHARNVLKDFDYFVYSTFSYSKETPYKTRVVVRLDEPIHEFNWSTFLFNMAHAIKIDVACRNLARSYYLPSCPKDSQFPPLFEVNSGRGMVLEDAAILKEAFSLGHTPDELRTLEKQFLGSYEVHKNDTSILEREESVIETSVVDVQSLTSFDYEDMLSDYAQTIEDNLDRNDSRYQFARALTYKAIMSNGKEVDWHNLIQFMYLATKTHGSKELQNGNTRLELESCIRSAYTKFDPTISSDDPTFINRVMRKVYDACNLSEKCMTSGQWQFNRSQFKEMLNNPKKFVAADYSYEALKERQANCITDFIKDHDAQRFIRNVFASELCSMGTQADLNTIGDFVFYCAKKIGQKFALNLEDVEKVALSNITVEKMIPEQQITKELQDNSWQLNLFLQTAIKLGYHAANGDRAFELSRNATQTKVPSATLEV